MVWDNEKSLYLIKLYEDHHLLWNHTDKNHYNKLLKEEAWNSISSKIKVPVQEVKKKIIALMGSYRREKSRQKRSNRTGDDRYRSKWFAYDSLNFLSKKNICHNSTDKISTKKRTSETATGSAFQMDGTSPEGSDQENSAKTVISASNPKRSNPFNGRVSPATEGDTKSADSKMQYSGSKRKDHDTSKSDKSLHKAIKLLKSTDDAYDIFGKYIANELRKYNNQTLSHVKKAINDIIFDADIGKIPSQNNEHLIQQYVRQQDYSYSRRCSNSTLAASPTPVASPETLIVTPITTLLSTPSPDNTLVNNDSQSL